MVVAGRGQASKGVVTSADVVQYHAVQYFVQSTTVSFLVGEWAAGVGGGRGWLTELIDGPDC